MCLYLHRFVRSDRKNMRYEFWREHSKILLFRVAANARNDLHCEWRGARRLSWLALGDAAPFGQASGTLSTLS